MAITKVTRLTTEVLPVLDYTDASTVCAYPPYPLPCWWLTLYCGCLSRPSLLPLPTLVANGTIDARLALLVSNGSFGHFYLHQC